MDESSPPRAAGDLAAACFGDGEVLPAQLRLIRSSLDRLEEAGAGAVSVPPDLIEQALAATVVRRPVEQLLAATAAHRPRPVLRPWMRMAAGVALLCTTGLLAVHVLRQIEEPELAALPIVETPAKRSPNVAPASRGPHASAAREPAPYVSLSPELKRALSAYLSNPAGAEAGLLRALGPYAARAQHVRLDDRLVALLRENRPLAGIRVETENGELLLLPPGVSP